MNNLKESEMNIDDKVRVVSISDESDQLGGYYKIGDEGVIVGEYTDFYRIKFSDYTWKVDKEDVELINAWIKLDAGEKPNLHNKTIIKVKFGDIITEANEVAHFDWKLFNDTIEYMIVEEYVPPRKKITVKNSVKLHKAILKYGKLYFNDSNEWYVHFEDGKFLSTDDDLEHPFSSWNLKKWYVEGKVSWKDIVSESNPVECYCTDNIKSHLKQYVNDNNTKYVVGYNSSLDECFSTKICWEMGWGWKYAIPVDPNLRDDEDNALMEKYG